MSTPTTTAATAPTKDPAASAEPSVGASDAIPVLRGQIDALDAAICRLVSERARLSQRIQTARMNNGGTRVQLGRERMILDAYRRALGPNGSSLADAILQVCRGVR